MLRACTQHCRDFMAQWSLYFSLCLPKKEAQLESSVSCSWDGTMNGRCSCCLPEISSSFVLNVTALPGRPGWWSGQVNSMPLFEEHILAPLSNEVMCVNLRREEASSQIHSPCQCHTSTTSLTHITAPQHLSSLTNSLKGFPAFSF